MSGELQEIFSLSMGAFHIDTGFQTEMTGKL